MYQEVFDYIEDNDVKFIRLTFCDPLGYQKNISIMANELKSVLTHGLAFDSSTIPCFADVTSEDLFLFPDISTPSLLPWRPNTNSVLRFYCDIKKLDGSDFEYDSRAILKRTIAQMSELGYNAKIGTECEFYLFKTDDNLEPTMNTLDFGTYLDVSPLDKGENIRREICLCLEEMNLEPRSSHHEQGPGQNEIDFKISDVLSSADNMLTFKSVVKSIAQRNGLFASFMPKPLKTKSGNGMHINISLFKDNENIFTTSDDTLPLDAQHFIAGILAKIQEISIFLNSNNNSYERFGSYEAPKYVSWAQLNASQLIRIPNQTTANAKIELRSPDPSVNPYLAYAVILQAGMDGIKNKTPLPSPVDYNLNIADNSILETLELLPSNLLTAIKYAKDSSLLTSILGEDFLKSYIAIKEKEEAEFAASEDIDAYYKNTYFYKL